MRTIRGFFNLLARFYDRVIGPPDLEALQKGLEPLGGVLLDLGGGTGRAVAPLAQAFRLVVVLDIAPRMLQESRKKDGLTPVLGDSARMPFRSETFDRVLCVDAFHHFLNQEDTVRELFRVLKPGGIAFFEEPNIETPWIKGVAFFERLSLLRSRFLSPGDLSRLLENAGFVVEEIAHPSSGFYHLRARRPR